MSNVVIRLSLCANHTNTNPKLIMQMGFDCPECEWEIEDSEEEQDCSVKDCEHKVWE